MNELQVQESMDKLTNIISQFKSSGSDKEGLLKINSYIADLKEALNNIFAEYCYNCLDILYTQNTDNEYFGVIVNPSIDGITAFKIFATGEPVRLCNYQLELDSKLFESDLTSDEITAVILFEISSILDTAKIDQVRNLIDIHLLADDEVISLRDSLNYNQLIIYGIKDALYKLSSIKYKSTEEDVLSNNAVETLNFKDSLINAQEKLAGNVFTQTDSLSADDLEPISAALKMTFLIYRSVQGYAVSATNAFRDAKQFTGSRLQKIELDKVIEAITRISGFTLREANNINDFFDQKRMYSLNELGLFKSLKQNGLRSIEDDYYEISVQSKSIDTEQDALFIIRSINSRLAILDDYIYNNTISSSEKRRWENLSKQYRELRNEILLKKINKRRYSDLFMDFDNL